MAIMATDMALTHKKKFILSSLLVANIAWSGEWQVKPIISINESYTDNVSLTKINKISSFVSQVSAGLDLEYSSRLAQLQFNGNSTYALYSHDHDLDNDFKTLNANGKFNLWVDGLSLVASTSTDNVSRNSVNNSLADLVTGDTTETSTYSSGIEYKVDNSTFILNSNAMYTLSESEDNIGNYEGTSILFNSQSKSGNSLFLWQIYGSYYDRKNNGLTGESYSLEAMLGASINSTLAGYLRFYDEDSKGNIANRENSSASIGPGIRWKITPYFYFDIAYNYSKDKNLSDDYVSANLNWQPSSKTSLTAGYSKRFYGNSYNLTFSHQLKRLTNSISYNETISAFERDRFQRVLIGTYLCPTTPSSGVVTSSCILTDNQNVVPVDSQLVNLFDQELVEGSEFSLNKTLNWQTQLKLSRTTLSLNISANERESLTSGQIDSRLNASLSVSRKVSGISDVTISGNFKHEELNKENPDSSGQDDYYRTISASYNRKLASSLSASFSLQYLDRNSSSITRTYSESRAVINLTKDF